MTVYGTTDGSLSGTLTGALTLPSGVTVPFGPRSDSISNSAWGFGDLMPQFSLRWNAGVNNYMTYVTGDIPVGVYSSSSLANIGIGHGTIDAGGGYTYFNPMTGHEFSAVLGSTYNFQNQSTNTRMASTCTSGARQFLTQQVQAGWSVISIKRSDATAEPVIGWVASSRKCSASVRSSDTSSRSGGCRAI